MAYMAERINLSISEEKLAQLIREGSLCAADFSCLDNQSKRKVWQLCLICCQKRIGCQQCSQTSCPQIERLINADK
ncbi:hypothetical protein FJD32_012080 [Shewanella sp. LC6]|nr:hypothetical protein CS023_16320 [Shewanella xiamenensis]PWH02724.1 hypothetical protein DIY08_10980 [Shewanella xiamenensis]PZP31433.1 MAG: hypothetical protein DI594_13770 [Shewanella oneidensis]QQK60167.1 hypothetical protein FJD32_012080 [Shewanella sp. LC6]TPE63434.1 hypothetical protein FJD33_04380 [Shewanella sp. LC2]